MLSPEASRQNLSSLERWKAFLRYDPTRWLLETNDPSLLLWYQIEIAHRPEDAPGVTETRERVLYSEPVQTIFAAQNELGFWGDASDAVHRQQLAVPHYHATLWNLALLAELGIPRTSRRARDAVEFVLQNLYNDNGTFAGADAMETGYLLRAFGYFNFGKDARVLRAARSLSERTDSFAARIAALWGWRAFCGDAEIANTVQEHCERILQDLKGVQHLQGLDAYTFPQFDPRDELFLLRVLAEYDRVRDVRVAPLIETLVSKQNERAQWSLERALNGELVTRFEQVGEPSRWITLNALRVITSLVLSEKD